MDGGVQFPLVPVAVNIYKVDLFHFSPVASQQKL